MARERAEMEIERYQHDDCASRLRSPRSTFNDCSLEDVLCAWQLRQNLRNDFEATKPAPCIVTQVVIGGAEETSHAL